MAQQNKYRDLDKNVYDLSQPYKINEKYTKPIGSISLIISFNNIKYYRTDGLRDIIINPYTEFGDYISSHLAVFLSVRFNGYASSLDLVNTNFVTIKLESNSNYNVFCLSGGSVADSNSNYRMNFRPLGNDGSFDWVTITDVSNTKLDSASVVFLIFPKTWL